MSKTTKRVRKATLDELLNRATDGLNPNKIGYFRASDFYRLLSDPFSIWCDFHAPREERVEKVDRHKELQMMSGSVFEEQFVHKHYPNAIKIEPERGFAALKRTMELMLEGAPVIYQPYLWLLGKDLRGKGDLLIRVDSYPSDLGPYHYTVHEIKQSKDFAPHHKLQAACYHYMVSEIQGYTPKSMRIVLPDKDKLIPYVDVRNDFLDKLQLMRDIRDGKIEPLPAGIDHTEPPWHDYANNLLIDRHDLTLLPGIGPSNREKIRQMFGIESIPELKTISKEALNQLLGEPTGAAIYHHVKAYLADKHIPVKEVQVIERKKRHLYFDLETSDEVHPTEQPHTYLIGVWDREKDTFVYFLGRGYKGEEQIWKDFLEYVGDPQDVCLYHWASYEQGIIDETIEKYHNLSSRLISLKESCIDLKEVVKSNFIIPVPTYSIKKVAPYLGFTWRQKEVGAFESMVLYWDWLSDSKKKDLIEKVIKYNEDDCWAMIHIDKKLFLSP